MKFLGVSQYEVSSRSVHVNWNRSGSGSRSCSLGAGTRSGSSFKDQFQLPFQAEWEPLERPRRFAFEEHGDVHVAPRAGGSSRHAAEEVHGDGAMRIRREESLEPALDFLWVHRLDTIPETYSPRNGWERGRT